MSILQLYKGVSLNNVSSYFPGKLLWGKSKFVMVVEISNVLPALLTIKVDIALSKRYSRQPQASNRKLMTRLCMCHCSCANFFRGKKVVRYFQALICACWKCSCYGFLQSPCCYIPRPFLKSI